MRVFGDSCDRAKVYVPLARTEPDTSNSLKPFVTFSIACTFGTSASRSAEDTALRSPGTVRARIRAAASFQACTRRVARTLTASAGRLSTTNCRVASRRPRGLPSHSAGQLARVVLTALSPSCGT
jgi:hypothetical protein